jgi:hypothetical protein
MSAPQRIRLAFLPFLPIALAVLVWLGFSALREGLALGGGEAWLMGWVLAFLVGMPLLVLGLAVAGAVQTHGHRFGLVPNPGEKIPEAGQ